VTDTIVRTALSDGAQYSPREQREVSARARLGGRHLGTPQSCDTCVVCCAETPLSDTPMMNVYGATGSDRREASTGPIAGRRWRPTAGGCRPVALISLSLITSIEQRYGDVVESDAGVVDRAKARSCQRLASATAIVCHAAARRSSGDAASTARTSLWSGIVLLGYTLDSALRNADDQPEQAVKQRSVPVIDQHPQASEDADRKERQRNDEDSGVQR
jgi:hypothetical protein